VTNAAPPDSVLHFVSLALFFMFAEAEVASLHRRRNRLACLTTNGYNRWKRVRDHQWRARFNLRLCSTGEWAFVGSLHSMCSMRNLCHRMQHREPRRIFVVTAHLSVDYGDHYGAITLELFFGNPARYREAEILRNLVRRQPGYWSLGRVNSMNSVNQLVDWLQSFDERVDLDELKAKLDDDSISAELLADHIHFSDEHYSRNLLAHGPQFYALVLCWKPGQASPIHDHKGASCGVRVIEGVATETSFRWQAGRLVEDSVTSMHAGEVCGSFDDDIHEIRNNGEGNLVTLHIYSPYLDNINLYDRDTGAMTVFSDPMVASLSSTGS
jgi:cysteine dioxygenase